MTKVLVITTSLRGQRYRNARKDIVDELKMMADRDALQEYIEAQTKRRLEMFESVGRGTESFDEIYKALQKEQRTNIGMSNSEAAASIAAWACLQENADIDLLAAAEFFSDDGSVKNLDGLRARMKDADAYIFSTPVYFGDRGSLASDMISFICNDPQTKDHVQGKVAGAVSVGAKRNGGQETSLIYILKDLANSGMLVVGNDAQTTSQYGGTVHAGDVGTAWQDDYGIATSEGLGRRVAATARLLARGAETVEGADRLKGSANIHVWILKDSHDEKGKKYIEELCQDIGGKDDSVDFTIQNFSKETIYRCIACDICPTHPGPADEYRCIIKNEKDLFTQKHDDLISPDAIIIAGYSSADQTNVNDVYQRFMERTRYLRRDAYPLKDLLVAPMVITEYGTREGLHDRIFTSSIRHNTILSKPIIATELDGALVKRKKVLEQLKQFAQAARKTTVGRLSTPSEEVEKVIYNPVGYKISREQDDRNIETGRIREAVTTKIEHHIAQSRKRLTQSKH